MSGVTQRAIRLAVREDDENIWRVLEDIIRAGDVYALPHDMTRDAALAYWFSSAHEVFVLIENDRILGTYYLRANRPGGGAHVANCGYATATAARGRGIASAMCLHSLDRARDRGFRSMQFNFVVSTNERAVKLWKKHGFNTVGVLPGAFDHPRLGFVDAFVMFRDLTRSSSDSN